MAQATTATIKTQLVAGSFPDNTLDEHNIFDYEQYEGRRRYPSAEIMTVQPESTSETKKSTDITVGYEIRYYTRNLGIRTVEVASQKSVEDVIMTQMESMVLQDHKITFESKVWTRKQVDKSPSHPSYTVSILRITVRQITTTTSVSDSTLTFVKIGSTVDSAPAANYTYTNVFDVDLSSGYSDVDEGYTGSHIPAHFAGHLQGRFIGSIMVKAADMGTGGDKLNRMDKLTTLGNKPIYKFIYVNLTSDSSTITSTFNCEIESTTMRYSTSEGTVFRIIAKLITDVAVVIT
jgi:hypothetical protein